LARTATTTTAGYLVQLDHTERKPLGSINNYNGIFNLFHYKIYKKYHMNFGYFKIKINIVMNNDLEFNYTL